MDRKVKSIRGRCLLAGKQLAEFEYTIGHMIKKLGCGSYICTEIRESVWGFSQPKLCYKVRGLSGQGVDVIFEEDIHEIIYYESAQSSPA